MSISALPCSVNAIARFAAYSLIVLPRPICYDVGVREERTIIGRLALVIYFFIAGTFLIAIPWTGFWSFVLRQAPWLDNLLSHPALRGAVSGFGLVLIAGAIIEIRDAITRGP
jgi:hypothetical protein